MRFFENLDRVAAAPLVIDRPRGSEHPRVPRAVYPVDYGHFEGTVGSDGDGVDVFCGRGAGLGVVGVIVTADPSRLDVDVEVKVLLDCTPDEIGQVCRFLEDVLVIGGPLVLRS